MTMSQMTMQIQAAPQCLPNEGKNKPAVVGSHSERFALILKPHVSNGVVRQANISLHDPDGQSKYFQACDTITHLDNMAQKLPCNKLSVASVSLKGS
jgi:hypothetical protein